MWAFKDHGKIQEAVFGREHPPGFRWLHECYRFAGLRLRLQLPPHRTPERHRPHPAPAPPRVDCRPDPQRSAACRSPRRSARRVGSLAAGRHRARLVQVLCLVKPDALADGWSRDRILSEITEAGYPAFWAATARSTSKSVSRMQALPQPSDCLLPANSATPA